MRHFCDHDRCVEMIRSDHKVNNLMQSFIKLFINIFLLIFHFSRQFQIYLSHNLPEQFEAKKSNNIEQRPGVESIRGNIFIFRDGSTAEVDDFIFCTGKFRNWCLDCECPRLSQFMMTSSQVTNLRIPLCRLKLRYVQMMITWSLFTNI